MQLSRSTPQDKAVAALYGLLCHALFLAGVGSMIVAMYFGMSRSTHDPQRFIRPTELRQKLEAAGFEVGNFFGMGPRGIDRRLDITFGSLPTTAIQYLGQASAI